MNDSLKTIDEVLILVRVMIGNNYGYPTESKLAKDWWNHYDMLKAQLQRIIAAERLDELKQLVNCHPSVPTHRDNDYLGGFSGARRQIEEYTRVRIAHLTDELNELEELS